MKESPCLLNPRFSSLFHSVPQLSMRLGAAHHNFLRVWRASVTNVFSPGRTDELSILDIHMVKIV